MNIKNALGFLVLGLVMYTTPVLAQSFSINAVAAESSVRAVWLEFMGWIIGGIGLGYLSREGVLRAPVLLAAMVPTRMLQPVEAQGEERIPSGVRVGVSS